MNLNNKVAVVTGEASGIGLEIAKTFSRAGANVVIADPFLAFSLTCRADLDNARRTMR